MAAKMLCLLAIIFFTVINFDCGDSSPSVVDGGQRQSEHAIGESESKSKAFDRGGSKELKWDHNRNCRRFVEQPADRCVKTEKTRCFGAPVRHRYIDAALLDFPESAARDTKCMSKLAPLVCFLNHRPCEHSLDIYNGSLFLARRAPRSQCILIKDACRPESIPEPLKDCENRQLFSENCTMAIGYDFPSGSFGITTGSPNLPPHKYNFGSGSSIHSSNNFLNVTIDAAAFRAEEIKVSVVGNQIVVEGKHAEKPDILGSIERHFVRKFALPRNALPESVVSSQTSDGMLTVSASAPNATDNSAHTIPVIVSGGGNNQSAQN